MTDRDPAGARSPAADLARLAADLYDGGTTPEAVVGRILRRLGQRFPLHLLAVQHERPPAPPRPVAGLRLHPGLAYWCVPWERVASATAALDRRGVLRGEAVACLRASEFLMRLRDAVVSLRCREAPLFAPGVPRPTPRELHALRARILHAIATGDPGWREPLRSFAPLVVLHDWRSLNNARRRLIELLALITRGHGVRDIAHPWMAAVRGIAGCWTMGALVRLFPAAAEPLAIACHPQLAADGERGPRSDAVRAALACIAARWREPISLADVAASVGVSSAHLARRFRAELGRSVGDELLRRRLAEARSLLATSRLTVLAVALRCGFNSVEHFHRVFRSALATTPTAWRREAREPEGAATGA